MLAACVPVKRLGQAKGRLASLLTPDERAALCLAMLSDVLHTLVQSRLADLIAVTSPSPEVSALAREMGVEYWPDRAGTLNGAVADALQETVRRGATAALVLPGDVPLVTTADIICVVGLGQQPRSVVVAPTRDHGTGALFVRPPGLVQPDFGGASGPRHLAAARAVGGNPMLAALPHLALDLDRPEDLLAFWQTGGRTATHALIRRMGPWRFGGPGGELQVGR